MKTTEKTTLHKELTDMFPCEFEAWRERGDRERYALSSAVMQFIETPAGWQANAEYRCEFGGLFPVQVRYTVPDEQCHLCLCSPGDVSAEWLMVLVSADGGLVRELMRAQTFAPDGVNTLLAVAAGACSMEGYTVRGLADFLTEEVLV